MRFTCGAIIGSVLALLVAGCAPAGTGSPQPTGTDPAAAFAGRTYRMNLPAGWVTLGSTAYESGIDQGAAMAGWLELLDLAGQHAFRAYEPVAGAGGLRLAINPVSPWRVDNQGVFQDQANIEALPGVVPGSVESVWVASRVGKGFGYRWSQDLDWGDGAPSRRICIGWGMLEGFDPVNVVFSWPAGTDRTADAETLMSTFEVTGNPVWSLEPGQTLPPSPTPFDKDGSPEPTVIVHDAPDLEALLPDAFDGRVLTKSSRTGEGAGLAASSPILTRFGRTPADFARAEALPSTPPLMMLSAQRLAGVSGADLLAAMLDELVQAGAEISIQTRGGREVTYVKYGAWPVWYWASAEVVYSIVAADAELERILALLH